MTLPVFENLLPSLTNFLRISNRPQDAVELQRKIIERNAIAAFAIAIIVFTLICLVSPGYLIPFLNHPVARIIILSLFAWQFFGFWLLWKAAPITKPGAILANLAVLIFCTVPLLAAPLLGPAIVTISNPLCNGLVGGSCSYRPRDREQQ